ncbi:hypothetical protein OT109_03805 [Phycisphaeraceae bacterium D3-23]
MMWMTHGLAQIVDLEKVSDGYNNARWDMPWEILVIGLGLVLILVAVISAMRWWKSRYTDPSALVLFSALSRKAGLGVADRVLLWRIARSRGLSSPIALLLARGALEQHSRAYRERLGRFSDARVKRRVAQIQAELFGPGG